MGCFFKWKYSLNFQIMKRPKAVIKVCGIPIEEGESVTLTGEQIAEMREQMPLPIMLPIPDLYYFTPEAVYGPCTFISNSRESFSYKDLITPIIISR